MELWVLRRGVVVVEEEGRVVLRKRGLDEAERKGEGVTEVEERERVAAVAVVAVECCASLAEASLW